MGIQFEELHSAAQKTTEQAEPKNKQKDNLCGWNLRRDYLLNGVYM